MGLNRLLRGIARRADAAVFCVAGSRARDEARLLRLIEGIHLTTTPRAANIMLIAGEPDAGLIAPALVAHDALAPPRATVWWRLDGEVETVLSSFPDVFVIEHSDPARALRRIHAELLAGERKGEAPLLADVEPAPWRGVGPYGQGGKGMTGGVPYGRPLPERADDRDGLKLDHLPVRIGPLFAPFPVGFALDVKLQGDVIQDANVENFADALQHDGSIFHDALTTPVAVRDLELARARSHLHWLSDAVAVSGAASLSERILRLSQRIAPGDVDAVRALELTLRRRGFLGWSTRGVGVIEIDNLAGITGPVARASSLPVDARTEEAAYRRLDFEPVVQEAGDTAARWIQRLREAVQALELADRAGDVRAGGSGAIESPRGRLTAHDEPSLPTADLVPSLVVGMEWGDAVATVVSLDLDMSAARPLGSHVDVAS